MLKNTKYFDILGLKPNLYYESSIRKKTLFGGIMSILFLIISILVLIYFFYEVFSRTSYKLAYNKIIDLNPILNITQIPYAFTITDEEGRIIQNLENQIRIYADYTSFHPNDFSNEISFLRRELIKLEKCNIKEFGEYISIFPNLENIDQYFCLPINKLNITLHGTSNDYTNPYSLISIKVSKCFNDPHRIELFPSVKCFNNTLINKNLENIFFISLFPDYEIDHSDSINPGKLIFRTEILQLNSLIFKRFSIIKTIVNYVTDYGFIFSYLVKQKYFQSDIISHLSDSSLTPNSNGLLALITLSLSKTTKYHLRYYIKLHKALGNIGGIIQGILFLFSYFVKIINKNSYFYNLALSAFIIHWEDNKKITYKKLPNESVLSQLEKNQNIQKYSDLDFGIKDKTINKIQSNPLKTIRINNSHKNLSKILNIKINNVELNKIEEKKNNDVITYNNNKSIQKNKLKEEKNFCFLNIIKKRENLKHLNKNLEKIIKRDLSLENILKIVNHVEIIKKDLLEKNIIETIKKFDIHEKIDSLSLNQTQIKENFIIN